MSQKQIEKPGQQEQEKPAEVADAKNLKNEELAKSTDDVLQEIDDLMEDALGETTVEDFISSYVQRGGQLIFLTLSSESILKLLELM